MQQLTTPPGTRRNGQGHFVPESLIPEIDKIRDDMVNNMVERAKAQQGDLAAMKGHFFREIDALVVLTAAEYDVDLGGAKGNLTLLSYDGCRKVQRSVADNLQFGPALQAAKQLIDNCLLRWSEGARPELLALVQNAFATDKEGKINTGRVLELRGYKIDDVEWQNAMAAIADALTVVSSTSYVRFYERPSVEEKWQAISLDMSSLTPGSATQKAPDPLAVHLWQALAKMCDCKDVAGAIVMRALVAGMANDENKNITLAALDTLLQTAEQVGQS